MLEGLNLAGYYAVETFKKILAGEDRVDQLGFVGGNEKVLAEVRFPYEYDALIDEILENKAKCIYGTLVRRLDDTSHLPFYHVVQVEFFDYIIGMTGTLVIPYDPPTATTPLKMYRVQTMGVQTMEVMEENDAIYGACSISLFLGMTRHPESETILNPYMHYEEIGPVKPDFDA
jgi:hypothetical protein